MPLLSEWKPASVTNWILEAQLAQLLLEGGDGAVVQVALPVEGRRAVVGQHLAGELLVDALGELARLADVGLGRLAPDQIGVRRIGQAALDGILDAALDVVEAFVGAVLAQDERLIALVDIAGDQLRRVGVGARHDQGGHVHHVGGQARGNQLLDEFADGHQHLAAHVAALLGRGELVLEVDAGRAGLDHRLHQLIGVERAAKARLGVGHDGRHPVDVVLAVHVRDLVGALQGLVDAAHQHRHAVHRVEALVGIGFGRGVVVARHLPAAHVDRLEAGLHHLHCLVAGDGAQRAHERIRVQQLPQAVGAHARNGVLDRKLPRSRRTCSAA
jgi:hypothetical protein